MHAPRPSFEPPTSTRPLGLFVSVIVHNWVEFGCHLSGAAYENGQLGAGVGGVGVGADADALWINAAAAYGYIYIFACIRKCIHMCMCVCVCGLIEILCYLLTDVHVSILRTLSGQCEWVQIEARRQKELQELKLGRNNSIDRIWWWCESIWNEGEREIQTTEWQRRKLERALYGEQSAPES